MCQSSPFGGGVSAERASGRVMVLSYVCRSLEYKITKEEVSQLTFFSILWVARYAISIIKSGIMVKLIG